MERVAVINPFVSAPATIAGRHRVAAPKCAPEPAHTTETAVDVATLHSSPDGAVDSDAPVSSRAWLATVALAVMAVSGLAVPAPALAAEPTLSMSLSDTLAPRFESKPFALADGPFVRNVPTSRFDKPIERKPLFDLPSARPAWRFDLETTNDTYPTVLGLTPHRYLDPANPGFTDDDGFTAGFGVRLTRTEGNTQTVTQARFDLVTEKGGWPPYTPTYGSRRTDLLDVAVQQNFRNKLNDRTEVYYGIGGGVQAIGPMDGQKVQEWWHEAGMGQRRGDALQHNYTTTSVSVSPVITGGVGARHQLDSAGAYHLVGAVEANAPLGPGFGAVRAKVGVEARPVSWVSLEGGVTATSVWSNHSAMDFAPNKSAVRPGAWVSATFNPKGTVQPYLWAETGGVRGEPQYGIGISISFGGGSSRANQPDTPWLSPTWR